MLDNWFYLGDTGVSVFGTEFSFLPLFSSSSLASKLPSLNFFNWSSKIHSFILTKFNHVHFVHHPQCAGIFLERQFCLIIDLPIFFTCHTDLRSGNLQVKFKMATLWQKGRTVFCAHLQRVAECGYSSHTHTPTRTDHISRSGLGKYFSIYQNKKDKALVSFLRRKEAESTRWGSDPVKNSSGCVNAVICSESWHRDLRVSELLRGDPENFWAAEKKTSTWKNKMSGSVELNCGPRAGLWLQVNQCKTLTSYILSALFFSKHNKTLIF